MRNQYRLADSVSAKNNILKFLLFFFASALPAQSAAGALIAALLQRSSCPGWSRASPSLRQRNRKDVDGRNMPSRDEKRIMMAHAAFGASALLMTMHAHAGPTQFPTIDGGLPGSIGEARNI